MVDSQEENAKCRLLPYKTKPILSAQELKEKIGWGISQFNIPVAWKKTMGEGVVVAVLDTGCDLNHVDLKNNLLEGYNCLDPKKDPIDDAGHGTHVAGIICAEKNEFGMVGVAPKTKVRPVKVLDGDGDGDIKHVVKGIRWAIEQKVDFISLSLGTPESISSLKKAIKEADRSGITIFAAAGNVGKSEHLLYPANYPEPISVGSIDKTLRRADFNNTGSALDFMAPGVDILSTVPPNWWAILSGSSMAQPYVCGLASLLLSYKRNIGLDVNLSCGDDYRAFFKKHTINIIGEGYAGDPFYQGMGIIWIDLLLQQLGLESN